MASIDVVIPNYNYGHYLKGCVESVLSQNVDNLRILIVDNASTDDSPAVARQIAAVESRVTCHLRPTNLGPHASFNDGIDWAQGDYFLILCSDDLLAPNALRNAVAVMENEATVNLTFGSSLFLSPEEIETASVVSQEPAVWFVEDGISLIKRLCSIGRNSISGPTVVVRTAAQKAAGYYNPKLTHADDLELWLRIAARGRVASTTAIQAKARVHSHNQSATVRNINEWNLEFEAAFRSFFQGDGASLPDAPQLLETALRAISNRSYGCALSSLWRREVGAGELLKHAIRLRPTAAIWPPLGYLVGKTLRDLNTRRYAATTSTRNL